MNTGEKISKVSVSLSSIESSFRDSSGNDRMLLKKNEEFTFNQMFCWWPNLHKSTSYISCPTLKMCVNLNYMKIHIIQNIVTHISFGLRRIGIFTILLLQHKKSFSKFNLKLTYAVKIFTFNNFICYWDLNRFSRDEEQHLK